MESKAQQEIEDVGHDSEDDRQPAKFTGYANCMSAAR